MTKGFAIIHDKSLRISFFGVKGQAKKKKKNSERCQRPKTKFLKDVKHTVSDNRAQLFKVLLA